MGIDCCPLHHSLIRLCALQKRFNFFFLFSLGRINRACVANEIKQRNEYGEEEEEKPSRSIRLAWRALIFNCHYSLVSCLIGND